MAHGGREPALWNEGPPGGSPGTAPFVGDRGPVSDCGPPDETPSDPGDDAGIVDADARVDNRPPFISLMRPSLVNAGNVGFALGYSAGDGDPDDVVTVDVIGRCVEAATYLIFARGLPGGFVHEAWVDVGDVPPGEWLVQLRARDLAGQTAVTADFVVVTVTRPPAPIVLALDGPTPTPDGSGRFALRYDVTSTAAGTLSFFADAGDGRGRTALLGGLSPDAADPRVVFDPDALPPQTQEIVAVLQTAAQTADVAEARVAWGRAASFLSCSHGAATPLRTHDASNLPGVLLLAMLLALRPGSACVTESSQTSTATSRLSPSA